MLQDEKLDRFLDTFLDGKSDGAVDTDFWEDTGEEEPARYNLLEYTDLLTAPKNKGKLPQRTLTAILLIILLIPLTIWIGIYFFEDRKYLVVSLVIVVYSMIPFFMTFESRKSQAREMLILAVLSAIAVAGRAAFFMVPSFKPVMAVVIISAVCFGAESGFLVGAVSMLASNMLFGQGPWTPWQMFAMGIIGFLAGILFQKGWLKARKISLCIYGFWAALFIYGGIMNPASLTMMSYALTKSNLLAIYMSGLPVDMVHGAATVLFLLIASKPMIEKLERIKTKYGLIEE